MNRIHYTFIGSKDFSPEHPTAGNEVSLYRSAFANMLRITAFAGMAAQTIYPGVNAGETL